MKYTHLLQDRLDGFMLMKLFKEKKKYLMIDLENEI